MNLPRIIPSLLLHGKGLVKGIKFENHRYIGDPINAIKIFSEKEADELVLLDITATEERRTISIEMVEKIADECYMPFAVGGGIKSINDVRNLIRGGAEKVCINTSAVENPTIIKAVAEVFGSQSIVVSIDVKKERGNGYHIYTYSGRNRSKWNLMEFVNLAERFGAGEFLITSIDSEGLMEGYDLELIKTVAGITSVPVIAGGGPGCLSDFVCAVHKGGASAVSAGSMFVFHGKKRGILINYPSRTELEKIFGEEKYFENEEKIRKNDKD
jgi:cyclase